MKNFRPPHRGNLDQGWFKCVLCGGRLWPESMIVEHEGKKYCRQHYAAKVPREKKDAAEITFIGKDYDHIRD
jgi:hypothetical protein